MLDTFLAKYGSFFSQRPPMPVEAITADMLAGIIEAMPDNTPGLDGVRKGDLLLFSPYALEWLPAFYQAIEAGASWPKVLKHARTAFLSKGEDDLDPKGYRGLAISSVCYRIWGVATLRRTFAWVQSWQTDDLFAGTTAPLGVQDAWYIVNLQFEDAKLQGMPISGGQRGHLQMLRSDSTLVAGLSS